MAGRFTCFCKEARRPVDDYAMKTVRVETNRLFLREMTPDDFDALYGVLADSDITRHAPYTFDENRVRNWIRRNMERYENDGFGLWAVCLRESGRMIGDCGLTLQNINGEIRPEIGYHMAKAYRRNGYAKEAARAVRDWAFRNTAFDAVYSFMKKTNIPSIATAKANGMTLVEEFVDSESEQTAVYGISRQTWSSQTADEENGSIRYEKLDHTNFDGRSLDRFIRRQQVRECWRNVLGKWKLIPMQYEEDWSLEQRRNIAEDVALHMGEDQTAFGAFDGKQLVGFITVSHKIFGETARYVEIVCFQISEPYRRKGIGRALFGQACEEARKLGAEKLYISAHSSKESQAAYKALGCGYAGEINRRLAEEEPFDVQMEFDLQERRENACESIGRNE